MISFKNFFIFSEFMVSSFSFFLVLYVATANHSKKEVKFFINLVGKSTILALLFITIYIFLNSLDFNIILNESFIQDSLSNSCKLVLSVAFLITFSLFYAHFTDSPRLHFFEFTVFLLMSFLGFFCLVSSNDFLTAYLSIELISVSSYFLTLFKKESFYSIDSGLKYFIIGALSSSLFLFGSSLIYGILGTINFDIIRIILIKHTTLLEYSLFEEFLNSESKSWNLKDLHFLTMDDENSILFSDIASDYRSFDN